MPIEERWWVGLCRHGITVNQAPEATPVGPAAPQLGSAVQQPQHQEPATQLLEGELEGGIGNGELQVCHVHESSFSNDKYKRQSCLHLGDTI